MSGARLFEVYFDFDNTVTQGDVLDDIIQRFSLDDGWKEAERAWESGEIGSRECLERQFSRVRLTEPVLREYLRTVRIDPAFRPIVEFLRSRGIEPSIASDSFASLIGQVLSNNGITGLPLLANEMRLEGDVPLLGFPYFHSICTKCGNCKTSHLFRRSRPPETLKIYVGDGLSDVCPAGFCEILFAKGTLLRHFAPLRRDVIAFENLDTVYSHLRQLLQ